MRHPENSPEYSEFHYLQGTGCRALTCRAPPAAPAATCAAALRGLGLCLGGSRGQLPQSSVRGGGGRLVCVALGGRLARFAMLSMLVALAVLVGLILALAMLALVLVIVSVVVVAPPAVLPARLLPHVTSHTIEEANFCCPQYLVALNYRAPHWGGGAAPAGAVWYRITHSFLYLWVLNLSKA